MLYLLQGPIHYDFLLPLDAATRDAFEWIDETAIPVDHPNATWLVVGWGAQAFYTTVGTYADVRPNAIWPGLTGDSAVLRLGVSGPLDPDWPIRRLEMSRDAYARMLRAIVDQFAAGAGTQPLPVPGYSDTDLFFPAKGRFNVFQTCNVWVGQMLRASGARFGAWTPTPYAVTISLKWFGLDR